MADDLKLEPKISVMPEQFLAMTRGAGLSVAQASPTPSFAPAASGAVAPVPPPHTALPTSAVIPPPSEGVPRGKRVLIVWGIIGVVVIIGGGLAAFLVLRSVPTSPPAPPTPPVNAAPVNIPVVNVPPVNEPAVPPPPPPSPPDRDTDGDGLTDAEELLLGTDVGLRDTDADGYDDRTELVNLYNPTGTAPQRIIDTDLVFEYTHPIDGWSIYVPRQWTIAATDQEQQEIVIRTSIASESIRMSFIDSAHPPVEGWGEMDPLVNRRGARGFQYRERMDVVEFLTNRPPPPIESPFLRIEYQVVELPARFPNLFNLVVQSFSQNSNAER